LYPLPGKRVDRNSIASEPDSAANSLRYLATAYTSFP